MLLWIAVVLLVLWALGLLVFHLGAIINVVLIVAIVAFVWHWISGRNRAK